MLGDLGFDVEFAENGESALVVTLVGRIWLRVPGLRHPAY